MLYNNLSSYFRERYGQRVKKICIDGGFSCPNRDGKIGTGGCIYCGERGSGEHIHFAAEPIRAQVEAVLQGAEGDDKFIAYFQNFSNTYADISTLKARYDAALCDERLIALAIGTRPDCLDEAKVKLISEYKSRCDVWVELGLQTSNEKTAKLINRGYKNETFEEAVRLLTKYGIPCVVHMIIGLPDEGKEDAVNTARYISSFGIWGIKIHSIYVMEGTALAEMFRNGAYTPPTLAEYAEACAECLGHIPESVVIHRLTGDCPQNLLVSPDWNADKNAILKSVTDYMNEHGIRQGSLI